MAAQSSILVWKIPWTEELGGLQSIGSERVGQDLASEHSTGMTWKEHPGFLTSL